jgi:hypothetical protein
LSASLITSFMCRHENADQLLLIGYISTFDKDVSPIQVLIFSYFPDFWKKKINMQDRHRSCTQ